MNFHPNTVRQVFDTALGTMIASAGPNGLNGLWFDGQAHLPNWQAWAEAKHPAIASAQAWVQRHLAGHAPDWVAPLDLSGGTAFQQTVWRQLLHIGCGRTRSYGELAQALGKPSAARAVGAAVGRNPISLIVPCHRVVGSSGSLTGYAGGLPRKTALLKLEGVLA